LVASIEQHLRGAEFTRPTGGMFCWLRLPGVDTSALLDPAIAAGMAFVPGAAFAVERDLGDHLRLSFATASPDELGAAVRRLAGVLG
jgi:2-aminoadipate transaminase